MSTPNWSGSRASTSPTRSPTNGDVAQYLDVCFLARYVGGEAAVSDDENHDVAWFSPDSLPDDLTSSSRLRLDKAVQDVPEAWFRR